MRRNRLDCQLTPTPTPLSRRGSSLQLARAQPPVRTGNWPVSAQSGVFLGRFRMEFRDGGLGAGWNWDCTRHVCIQLDGVLTCVIRLSTYDCRASKCKKYVCKTLTGLLVRIMLAQVSKKQAKEIWSNHNSLWFMIESYHYPLSYDKYLKSYRVALEWIGLENDTLVMLD